VGCPTLKSAVKACGVKAFNINIIQEDVIELTYAVYLIHVNEIKSHVMAATIVDNSSE
jgi:hypothetical protein